MKKKSNVNFYKINKQKKEKYKAKYFAMLRAAEDFSSLVLEKVNALNDLNGGKFKQKTNEFKAYIQKNQLIESKVTKDFLASVFAVAYRAIHEVYGISLFKVQIMGGYALFQGDVAEMKTGEGKTLTAILPAYFYALFEKGVHIITVNEYLATRDAFNTGKVFNQLGISVGYIVSKMTKEEKNMQYLKDVTYSTNSEIGFDYLRDNLVRNLSDKVQRGFNYAIIDEVDSILIDEARTPLIISGGVNFEDSDYISVDNFSKTLVSSDYTVDRETRQAFLTTTGIGKAEETFKIVNLFSYENSRLVHLIINALQANYIYKFDVDYTVRKNQIVLIDSFTGRFLEGRQFSEGLNQAIEAKERVEIKPETKTFASITYQNLFRMYKKLSGMSGTALTEEEEFLDVYNMRVLQIPTNLPIKRIDLVDVIFATKLAKYKAVIKRVYEIHNTGQPILLGTRSVFESEILSKQLTILELKHEVLNAKNHAREAEIIAKAGQKNQITIATNMAGRGTDIKLGIGVIELGGLFVIGTERNESRRIDNQLRGRSGRQGDIGYSQFYVSLDDEIMQRAGLKRIQKFVKSIDETPIVSRSVQRSITVAQKKIEGLNYDYRKSIVEYDDVLNVQRLLTYKQRDRILTLTKIDELIFTMIETFIKNLIVEKFCYDKENRFDSIIFFERLIKQFQITFTNNQHLTINKSKEIAIKKLLEKLLQKKEYLKTNKIDLIIFVKNILLTTLDMNWQDQIDRLSKLKLGIRYRQYAQKNPVQIYIQEADKLFKLYREQIVEQGITFILNSIIKTKIAPLDSKKSKHRITKEMIIV